MTIVNSSQFTFTVLPVANLNCHNHTIRAFTISAFPFPNYLNVIYRLFNGKANIFLIT